MAYLDEGGSGDFKYYEKPGSGPQRGCSAELVEVCRHRRVLAGLFISFILQIKKTSPR